MFDINIREINNFQYRRWDIVTIPNIQNIYTDSPQNHAGNIPKIGNMCQLIYYINMWYIL